VYLHVHGGDLAPAISSHFSLSSEFPKRPIELGFTLIEILIVVLIIGITLGFALLAFGDFGANRRAVVSAEEFSSYIKLVQHQAILEANALGVRIDKQSYETYRFEHGIWQPMPEKSIFHRRILPSPIVANLRNNLRNAKNPAIVITGSGAMTEFIIDFGTEKKPDTMIVIGKKDGQLILQHSNPS